MLVLERKKNEEVVIVLKDGREIVVCLIDIRGENKAVLGIDCDRDIKVHRREVWEEIKAEMAKVVRS